MENEINQIMRSLYLNCGEAVFLDKGRLKSAISDVLINYPAEKKLLHLAVQENYGNLLLTNQFSLEKNILIYAKQFSKNFSINEEKAYDTIATLAYAISGDDSLLKRKEPKRPRFTMIVVTLSIILLLAFAACVIWPPPPTPQLPITPSPTTPPPTTPLPTTPPPTTPPPTTPPPTIAPKKMGPFAPGYFTFVNGASVKIPEGFEDRNRTGDYQTGLDVDGYWYYFYNDKHAMEIFLSEAKLSSYINSGKYGTTGGEVLKTKYEEFLAKESIQTWKELNEYYYHMSGYSEDGIYYYYGVWSGDTIYMINFKYPKENRGYCDPIVEKVEESFMGAG